MQRNEFIQRSALGGLDLTFPVSTWLNSCGNATATPSHSLEFKKLMEDLLKDWFDGMIKIQVIAPSKLALTCSLTGHLAQN